jgi:hypothetical protein
MASKKRKKNKKRYDGENFPDFVDHKLYTGKVVAQHKEKAIRDKYGPSRRSAPVTVRSLETGEVLSIEAPSRYRAM